MEFKNNTVTVETSNLNIMDVIKKSTPGLMSLSTLHNIGKKYMKFYLVNILMLFFMIFLYTIVFYLGKGMFYILFI
jgi:hypothetical protein